MALPQFPDNLKTTKQEVMNYCFQVWRNENRDFSKAAKVIAKEKYCGATRATLSRWATKFNWDNRANEQDLKETNATSIEDEVLANLVEQHRKIKVYLDNADFKLIDSAKLNAFTTVSKQIVEITSKIKKDKLESVNNSNDEQVQFTLVRAKKNDKT